MHAVNNDTHITYSFITVGENHYKQNASISYNNLSLLVIYIKLQLKYMVVEHIAPLLTNQKYWLREEVAYLNSKHSHF